MIRLRLNEVGKCSHTWGEEGVDWKGIGDAAAYIGEGIARWGRIPVMQWKEKWGQVCVYNSWGVSSWYGLCRPTYHFCHWPRWSWRFIGRPYWYFQLLSWLIYPYQVWVYRRFYRKALENWPHLRGEILAGATWRELLEDLTCE